MYIIVLIKLKILRNIFVDGCDKFFVNKLLYHDLKKMKKNLTTQVLEFFSKKRFSPRFWQFCWKRFIVSRGNLYRNEREDFDKAPDNSE